MTKEEYKAERKRISSEIEALKKLEKELEVAYIEEHCPFDGGDKVKITTVDYGGETIREELTGIVCNCRASFDGELNYSFRKVKKDGTASYSTLYVYGKIKSIELIEKAKTV